MEFGTLESFQICYETYGSPNADKSNVILICHALTGDHHVAGVHNKKDGRYGWWDHAVGPGKAIDTNCVLCHLFKLSRCMPGFNGLILEQPQDWKTLRYVFS